MQMKRRADLHPARPTRIANFDRVARIYRWAEYLALGSLLKRTREHFLDQIQSARKALLLGDGDGRFASALLSQVPALRLRAVDSSARMLYLLKQRCLRTGCGDRLTTELRIAPDIALEDGCDLIVTHFFLDCLLEADVRTLTRNFARQAPRGVRWVVSEFGLPRGHLAGFLASVYIRLLYWVFRLLTNLPAQSLPPIAEALQRAGFQRLARAERLGGFLYSELWELAPSNLLGATSAGGRSSTYL